MTNFGYRHSKRCRGYHIGIRCSLNCARKVHWYSNDPREVHENKTGQKSIWIRKGADRY